MKVEDLLASIRKSVDDDMDGLGSSMASQSRGTLMRGALREMRVNLGGNDLSSSVQDEISTLRERIRAKVAAKEINLDVPAPAPVYAKPLPAPAPQRGNFSNILDVPTRAPGPGSHMRSQVERSQQVPLRSTHFDDAASDVRYQHEADTWDQGSESTLGYDTEAQGESYHQDDYREEYHQQYPALQAPLLSPHAEAAAETAFRQLSDSLLARATGDRSIEDMTRELLRGMIKQWLDANLPTLVEELVREEIERVARRGR
jgi:cell pole-organizing protein PopZ